jgi:hypothetical protein
MPLPRPSSQLIMHSIWKLYVNRRASSILDILTSPTCALSSLVCCDPDAARSSPPFCCFVVPSSLGTRMHHRRGVSPQHVHKYQSCPGCSSRTAVPPIFIHIPTALMHSLRPDGRHAKTRHRQRRLLSRCSVDCQRFARR